MNLTVALKEWKIVVDLMVEGRCALLLRKGGVHERSGPGVFELDHPRFLLLPSWAHQKPAMIKPAFRDRVEALDEPSTITFTGWADAAGIWRVPSRTAFDALDDLHPFSPDQVDMRFHYKPENPLHAVLLRVHRLAEPVTATSDPSYFGCVSWVELNEAIDVGRSVPAIDDAAFGRTVERVGRALA